VNDSVIRSNVQQTWLFFDRTSHRTVIIIELWSPAFHHIRFPIGL